MPATISAAGLTTWGSVVLGQTLASLAAIIVDLGYDVNGPGAVATRSLQEGVRYFFFAQRARLVIGVPCLLVMTSAMFVIPNPDPIAGILGSAQIAIAAFSARFFYVGRAAPRWYLFAEITPRVISQFVAALALVSGAPLLLGLALPGLGAVLGVAISMVTMRRACDNRELSETTRDTSYREEFRMQFAAVISSLINGGRYALPVIMCTAIAPGIVGHYGVFDRLGRQATAALTPVTATFQGWVPRRMSADATLKPAFIAMSAAIGCGAVVALAFIAVGSPLTVWLSAGDLRPTMTEVTLFGISIALGMIVQVINLACLVPLAGIKSVVLTNVIGLVALATALPLLLSAQQSVELVLEAILIGYGCQLAGELYVMRRRTVQQQRV
ncbi:hypothetical protein [Mycobacterium sp. PSTR-4-N]|uniref:hypothetical protein n=1 Tax=Mycobacterium sp. PSTR-4-N TaxID=2917745 RepID=UPI001F149E25|nr:hypothetical protein [Mycobacterium sp. PSTR-4-N]MCG7592775.1 hypothetical protein [Mycobacterium sp. PSTR-4-N]